MPSSPRSLLLVVGVVTAVVLGVTGCSSPSQSKAAACSKVLASMDAATSELNGGLSSMSTDPGGAAQSLKLGKKTLFSGMKSVTNPEVKSAGDRAAASVSVLTDLVTAVIAKPGSISSTKLAASSTAVSAEFAAVRKLCA